MKINQIWTSRGLWVVPAHQIRIRASLYFDNKRTNVYIFAYRARRSQRTGCCLTVSPVPVKSFCSAHGLPFLCTVRLIHWWIPRLNLSVAVTWCDKQQKATKKKNLKRKKKWNLRQKSFGCLSAKRTSTLLPLERVQLRACHRGCSLWFFFIFIFKQCTFVHRAPLLLSVMKVKRKLTTNRSARRADASALPIYTEAC